MLAEARLPVLDTKLVPLFALCLDVRAPELCAVDCLVSAFPTLLGQKVGHAVNLPEVSGNVRAMMALFIRRLHGVPRFIGMPDGGTATE